MKKTVLLYLFITSVFYLAAQDFQLSWQQCYGGSEKEEAMNITEVPGGYFIVGWTESDNGDVLFNHGGSDGWIIKIDSAGNKIWEKTYGGTEGDNFIRIIPDNYSNFFILAASNSSNGDISYDPYPGNWDQWILKVDMDGNIIWDKIIGGNAGDIMWNASPTSDGGVITIGWTYSNDGDVSVTYGGADTWMAKISSEGELEWDFTIGTDWIDKGMAAIQTSDGGYLMSSNSIILEGNVGNITCIPHSYGWMEGVLFKLDSNLNVEWQRCYGGSNSDNIGEIIEVEDGYILLAGTYSNDGDVSGWHSGYNHLGNPTDDIWIVKIDFSGNIIWQKCYGGSGNEYATNIFPSDNNGYVIFGETDSNDGDVLGNHSSSEFDSDIWMTQISDTGQLLFQKCIGGAGSEDLYFGVVKKNDYDYIISGITDYGPSYDVHCTPHGGFNDKDYWVFEFKDCVYYAPATPATPCGADTACSAGGSGTVYTVAPAQNAWSYAWQLLPETAGTINGDSTAVTVSWAENYEGMAAITVRSQNDCGQSNWSELKYTQVQTCLGTEETPAENMALRVYPNPAKDYVVFEFDVKSSTEIKIYDAFGREVSCLPVSRKKTVWKTKNLRSGLYYYKTKINGKALSGKVVLW